MADSSVAPAPTAEVPAVAVTDAAPVPEVPVVVVTDAAPQKVTPAAPSKATPAPAPAPRVRKPSRRGAVPVSLRGSQPPLQSRDTERKRPGAALTSRTPAPVVSAARAARDATKPGNAHTGGLGHEALRVAYKEKKRADREALKEFEKSVAGASDARKQMLEKRATLKAERKAARDALRASRLQERKAAATKAADKTA